MVAEGADFREIRGRVPGKLKPGNLQGFKRARRYAILAVLIRVPCFFRSYRLAAELECLLHK